jgi:hypothetical protein
MVQMIEIRRCSMGSASPTIMSTMSTRPEATVDFSGELQLEATNVLLQILAELGMEKKALLLVQPVIIKKEAIRPSDSRPRPFSTD